MNTTFSIIFSDERHRLECIALAKTGGLPFQRKCEIEMCTQTVQRLNIFVPNLTLFRGMYCLNTNSPRLVRIGFYLNLEVTCNIQYLGDLVS